MSKYNSTKYSNYLKGGFFTDEPVLVSPNDLKKLLNASQLPNKKLNKINENINKLNYKNFYDRTEEDEEDEEYEDKYDGEGEEVTGGYYYDSSEYSDLSTLELLSGGFYNNTVSLPNTSASVTNPNNVKMTNNKNPTNKNPTNKTVTSINKIIENILGDEKLPTDTTEPPTETTEPSTEPPTETTEPSTDESSLSSTLPSTPSTPSSTPVSGGYYRNSRYRRYY
jgi:hypothetical protein